jgi:predicted MFS family arabinose efflux permease
MTVLEQTDQRELSNPTPKRGRTGVRPAIVLLILVLIQICNGVDRFLVAALAEPIKHDLKLSDTQLGLLSGMMFAAFYSVFGLFLGWLSDRTHRVRMLATVCAIWSMFSGACGLATSFAQMALLRVGVAIGEAGSSPPAYSLTCDYFPPLKRGKALAMFSLAIALGSGIATIGGGYIAAHFGWRAAFFATALPGVLLSAILLIFVAEPRRGRLDPPTDTKADPQSILSTMKTFARDAILRNVTIGAALLVFASHGVTAWLPAFLMRTKGMEMKQMALYYGSLSTIGMIVGAFGAGWAADKIAGRRYHWLPLIPAAAYLVSIPAVLLAATSSSWGEALVFLVIPLFAFQTYHPIAFLLVQNKMPANQRSVSASVLLLFIYVVGVGGGVTYVGIASDFLAKRVGANSLAIAFLTLVPIFVLAIFFQWRASRQMLRHGSSGPRTVIRT